MQLDPSMLVTKAPKVSLDRLSGKRRPQLAVSTQQNRPRGDAADKTRPFCSKTGGFWRWHKHKHWQLKAGSCGPKRALRSCILFRKEAITLSTSLVSISAATCLRKVKKTPAVFCKKPPCPKPPGLLRR